MRFSDRTKTLGSCDILLSHRFIYISYTENYIINQDGQLLVIGSISCKRISNPVIINMRGINGNDI